MYMGWDTLAERTPSVNQKRREVVKDVIIIYDVDCEVIHEEARSFERESQGSELIEQTEQLREIGGNRRGDLNVKKSWTYTSGNRMALETRWHSSRKVKQNRKNFTKEEMKG